LFCRTVLFGDIFIDKLMNTNFEQQNKQKIEVQIHNNITNFNFRL
jgi:hypothetical protein